MNTQDKSLKLAELMPEVKISESGRVLFPHDYYDEQWNPYENLAQFAAILLKFPEVMRRFNHYPENNAFVLCISGEDTGHLSWEEMESPPTQSNILDEILRMNGVEL